MPHPTSGYRNKDGKKVPGVTTIIGRFKESGGLLYWAFEQGKAAERGEISRLYDRRDDAADAGTLAHLLVEAHINGTEPPDIPDNEIGEKAMQGYRNYCNWEENSKIEIISQEMELVSEKYQFGGCPDAVGRDSQGRTILIDWKTSSGLYIDFLTQLGGYSILWDENHPDQIIDGGFHLCRFSKEYGDFHHHYWAELGQAIDLFILFRKAYDLDKKLKKRL